MNSSIDTSEREMLRKTWIWYFVLGVISLIGSFLAFVNPFAATFATVHLIAGIFILIGVVQVFQSFRTKDWGGFLGGFLMGIVAVLIGISLFQNPFAGILSLTAIVAILFFVFGIAKVFIAYKLRSTDGWIWILVSGLVSIILAVMIFTNFPWSAMTVLGVLLGVELLSNGVTSLLFGLALRKS